MNGPFGFNPQPEPPRGLVARQMFRQALHTHGGTVVVPGSTVGFNPQPEPPRGMMYGGSRTAMRGYGATQWVGATPRAEWGGGYAGPTWIGATPSSEWGGGYAGALGVLVPTPLPGQPSYAPNMQATGYNYCGSKFGFQQMLQDLGYYKGPIDGAVGTGTLNAAKAFAAANGAPWGGALSNAFCQRLLEVWQQRMQPAADVLIPPTTPPATTPTQTPPPPAGRPTTGTPPNGMVPPQPGTQAGPPAPGAEPSVFDKAKAWWDGQSTGVKVAIGVGGVAVIGGLLWLLFGRKKTASATPNRRRYKKNRRRPPKLTAAQRGALRRIRGARSRVKTGKIVAIKGGRSYGHLKPPKRYWQMGARRQSDYAAPEQWGYPLVFRNERGGVNLKKTRVHIGQAKMRFGRNKQRYPMPLRRKIARNINKAARRYGLPANVKP